MEQLQAVAEDAVPVARRKVRLEAVESLKLPSPSQLTAGC